MAHPAITPLRIVLVVALLSTIGFLGWASTWPEKESDDGRIAVPTAPQQLEGGPEGEGTQGETVAGDEDGATEAPTPDLPGGENPSADTVPVTGALGDYQVPVEAAKRLLQVAERVKYLDGYSDAERLKHAVVVCEKVAFQDWTWAQQIAGDVAFEVPYAAARKFAEQLETDFCAAVGLRPEPPTPTPTPEESEFPELP